MKQASYWYHTQRTPFAVDERSWIFFPQAFRYISQIIRIMWTTDRFSKSKSSIFQVIKEIYWKMENVNLSLWPWFYLKIASSRLTIAHGVVDDPLCMMARWKRSRDSAESKWCDTETAPALSPNNVIRLGSANKTCNKKKNFKYNFRLNVEQVIKQIIGTHHHQNIQYYLWPT